MKKVISCIFSAFVLVFLSLFTSIKVSAVSQDIQETPEESGGSGLVINSNYFWSDIGGFEVVKVDNNDEYEFYEIYNSSEVANSIKEYNYNFSYDYEIRTSLPIKDDNKQVFNMYGSYKSVVVNYVNLKNHDLDILNPIKDEIKIYKYNFVSKEFNLVHAPGKNEEGTYTLALDSKCALYKIVLTGLSSGTKETYVVIDDNIVNGSIDSVSVNQEEKSVIVTSSLVVPFDILNMNHEISLSIGNVSVESMITDTELNLVNGNSGLYELVLTFTPTESIGIANNETIKLVVDEFAMIKEQVSYDFIKPTMERGKFYNSSLIKQGFALSGKVSKNWAYLFEVADEGTGVASVSTETEGIVCSHEGEKAICLGDASVGEGLVSVRFIVTDVAGNSNSRVEEFEVDTDHIDDEYLDSIVNIENNDVSVSETEGIYKLCIFYGETLEEIYECNYGGSISSAYYYTGPVTIVALDESANMASVSREVVFKNGYDVSGEKETDILTNSLLDNSYENVLPQYIENPQNIKYFVKYGDLIEEYDPEEVISLSALDILNQKYQKSDCAFNKCDIKVEAFMTFDIAGVEQKISDFYILSDNSPNIKDKLSTLDITLDYKKFDINNVSLKTKLYAEGLRVGLIDENEYEYSGKVTSSFVSYIDKNGVVTKLENEPYDYISTVSKLGTYLLECKVQILKNNTTNDEYTDRYGKSFFIRVKLEDKTLPTITLTGESEVTLKQYDVYKDSSAICEDDTECVITVNYYFNGLDNKVESIDTSKPGTYTIEYVATDEGGNVATTTRTIVVQNINSLDTTSIIVIVSVAVLFIIFVTTGIIIQKKKARPTSREE